MAKSEELPKYSPVDQYAPLHRRRRCRRTIAPVAALACLTYLAFSVWQHREHYRGQPMLSVDKLHEDFQTCAKLRQVPHDPSGPRERNARYVEGQRPILIRNATVWTGEPQDGTSAEDARNGTGYEWIQSDILLRNGLITRVQPDIQDQDLPKDCQIFDARGKHLTAGIVDMHSHTGVDTLPELVGQSDDNELSSDITPYVRSIDGFNPLDPQIQVIKSGGVTTSLILPGSGNNIGGEAFVIKHSVGKANGRPEISAEDMLADPDRNWRYMKMACGENAKSVYGRLGRNFGPFSRLGEAWYFRHAFEEATKLKRAQDDWCEAADRVGAQNMQSYLPTDLQWESLSAVLRGQVHVNTHCYTIPDLDSFVGYTNEFKFAIRAFHHAHQTYLVPEILKRAYGGRAPAAALFADSMNYKAESYTASEQAGKVLYEAGITPVYVSDNPVINAQHVVFEAAKAYRYGLPYHVALAGVTSASAELLGLGERIGKVKIGFDADITVWDSDPLSVGATPVQVFIDGAPQFEDPVELKKPHGKTLVSSEPMHQPQTEMEEKTNVILTGISKILLPGIEQTFASGSPANVVISNGSISCIGECVLETAAMLDAPTIALKNGHITPPATIIGSLLGLEEIQNEDVTSDGGNSASTFSTAIDGLSFDGKNLAAAYRRGVTKAVSAPSFQAGGLKGVSAGFRIHARHALDSHAIFAPHAAVHYTFTPAVKGSRTPSISAAVAELRRKLYTAASHLSSSSSFPSSTHAPKDSDEDLDEETHFLIHVLTGDLPLVLIVHSADVIATLLRLKAELEAHLSTHLPAGPSSSSFSSSLSSSPPQSAASAREKKIKLIIHGGAEAHLVAAELAGAGVGVVLAPLQAWSASWDQRRSLAGAPRTNGTAVDVLHAAGVRVAIGVAEDWEARDLWLLAGVALANGNGAISEREAVRFVSGNVYAMLGLEDPAERVGVMEEDEEEEDGLALVEEFVVFDGSPFEIDGQVRAVADGSGVVNIWM